MNYSLNLRFFSELEVLYHGESPRQRDVILKDVGKPNREAGSRNVTVAANPCLEDKKMGDRSKGKKRKRVSLRESLEVFEGFCETVVNRMMAQQEEMHSKLLKDMVDRDEERMAREEAWKKQEMDRINKEIEIRAHEQAIAGDRQATIVRFLEKFTSIISAPVQTLCFGMSEGELSEEPNSICEPPTSPFSSVLPQNPNHTIPAHLSSSQNQQLEASSLATPTNPNAPAYESQPSLNPHSLNTRKTPSTTSNKDEEHGKRWPREEVLALINLRSCSLNGEDKESSAKGPLWQRISQGMLALGYKRSAKRCKEKWENINKYFRKTKDDGKKRPLESRTCPYFHQLSTMYGQGTPGNCLNPPENPMALLKNPVGKSNMI